MIVGYPEDTNVDGTRVDVQEFLHHHGHVPTHAVLCLRWGHPLWLRQVRGGPGQVSSVVTLWSVCGHLVVSLWSVYACSPHIQYMVTSWSAWSTCGYLWISKCGRHYGNIVIISKKLRISQRIVF